MTSEVVIRRMEAERVTEEARLEAWRDAHPSATDADVAAFDAARAAAARFEAPPRVIDPELESWLADTEVDAWEMVVLRPYDMPAPRIPRVADDLWDTDPVMVLDAVEARALAIEARKTEVGEAQAELEFTEPGMDAPWMLRLTKVVLDDGETWTSAVRPGPLGEALSLPVKANTRRLATWWHELNLELTSTSAVRTKLCHGTTCSTHVGTASQSHRVRVDANVGGNSWCVKFIGDAISASTEADYYYAMQQRAVFVSA